MFSERLPLQRWSLFFCLNFTSFTLSSWRGGEDDEDFDMGGEN